MKKKILIITTIILIIILIVVGIYYTKYRTNKMICTYSIETDVYAIKSKYVVTYKNKIVSNIYTKEIFKNNDEKTLKNHKLTLDTLYQPYNNLKYYDYEVVLKDNQVISKTNINYKKIDIEKFKKIDSSNNKILTNNKVVLKTIKKIYKNNGARCIYR